MSASIGMAQRSDASIGADAIIQEADEAMYEAKHDGKGRVVRSAPVSLRSGPVA
jgi:PleD family two-component response regulator